jgi:hypothetical protein
MPLQASEMLVEAFLVVRRLSAAPLLEYDKPDGVSGKHFVEGGRIVIFGESYQERGIEVKQSRNVS